MKGTKKSILKADNALNFPKEGDITPFVSQMQLFCNVVPKKHIVVI